MADEDITLNEDQLLESLEETNGEQETGITTEAEVSESRQQTSFFFVRLECKSTLKFAEKALSARKARETKRQPFSKRLLPRHTSSRLINLKNSKKVTKLLHISN